MALLNVEVVMGTKDVARNNTSEVATVLLVVSLEKMREKKIASFYPFIALYVCLYLVLHIDHSFGIAVAKI